MSWMAQNGTSDIGVSLHQVQDVMYMALVTEPSGFMSVVKPGALVTFWNGVTKK